MGFTLAEVLITLGIIGIVAAMTLPSVVNKYRAKVLETGLKKSYANLQNAYMLTKSSLGVPNLRDTYGYYDEEKGYIYTSEFYNELKKQLRVLKEVDFYPIKNYNGTKIMTTNDGMDMPQALNILADGSSFGFHLNNSAKFRFWVDTNGPYKGPNRYGFDIFEFQVNDSTDKLKPMKPVRKYTEEELENEKWPDIMGYPCDGTSTQGANGVGCAWYAVNDINPDDETKTYWDNLPK